MAQLTIDLPTDLEARVRARMDSAGYADSQSYLLDLINADTNGLDIQPPLHLSPRTRDELERLISEGLSSGSAVEITAPDWDERRQQLALRHVIRTSK